MKKVLVGSFIGVIILVSSVCYSATEDDVPHNLETHLSIGLGVGHNPGANLYADPRLYISVDTRDIRRGTSLWTVQINLKTTNPEIFWPLYVRQSKDEIIGAYINGMIAVAAGAAVAAGIEGLMYYATLEEAAAAAALAGGQVVQATLPVIGAAYLAFMAIEKISPHAEKWYKSDKPMTSQIRLAYQCTYPRTDEEETKLFYEEMGQKLRNDDDDESPIMRVPGRGLLADVQIGETDSIQIFKLFHTILSSPIPHIVDVYKRLQTLVRSPEDHPLRFQYNGISPDLSRYVRNWNSFCILASERCFGVPFSVDPRLQEYVDDKILRERWDSAVWPVFDNVIQRILISFERIQARDRYFSMRYPHVRYAIINYDTRNRFSKLIWSSPLLEDLEKVPTSKRSPVGRK